MSRDVNRSLQAIHKNCDTSREALERAVCELEDFLDLEGVLPEDKRAAKSLHKQLNLLFEKLEKTLDQNNLSIC